ncbi:MAG: hypothetical protein M3Y31_07550, partial [Gemmatimonadota bacterium]|nr:hypothetical protein [Gemmatimonadota bacterium]
MDGVDREAEERELATLRRRAYGPDADIDADPVARARLIALEDRLRGRKAGVDAGEPADPADAAAPEPPPEPSTPRRPAWHSTLVASCAAAAVVLGALAAGVSAGDASTSDGHLDARTGLIIADPVVAAFVTSPQTRLLLSIPLD